MTGPVDASTVLANWSASIGEAGAASRWIIMPGALDPTSPEALYELATTLGTVVDVGDGTGLARIAHIVPATDDVYDHGAVTESFHTDSAGWVPPNDLTCLLCVAPDQNGGGRTRLLTASDFACAAERATGWDRWVLTHPLPWKIAAEFGGGVRWAPVFDGDAGTVRWAEPDAALELDEVAAMPKGSHLLAVLRHLHRALASVAPSLELALGAGDLLVFDNRRCLHARTAVSDPSRSARHLLRAKVVTRGFRSSR